MFIILRYFIPAVWFIKIIVINEIKTIVYLSVNSTASFGLTDQHQADQKYGRMSSVIWKYRAHVLKACIIRLSVCIYKYILKTNFRIVF